MSAEIGGANRSVDIAPPSRHAEGPDEPDFSLDRYQTDVHRVGTIAIGQTYTPEQIVEFQYWARYGDPRRLYEVYDSYRRFGPGPQIRRAKEAIKSARATFRTNPIEYDDDDTVPPDANRADVKTARDARDLIQKILTPKLDELLGFQSGEHFYGISDMKVTLGPRMIDDQYEGIASLEEVPARRHRLDPVTHEWMLMLSPISYEGTPIKELQLRTDRGTSGLFFCELGRNAEHLDQRGLYYEILDAWGVQNFGFRRWVDFNDAFGIPPRIGFTDLANKQRASKMAEMLRKMGARTWGLFQTGSDVKLLEARNMGANDPHKTLNDECKAIYNSALLGHEETTSTKPSTGNRDVTTGAISQLQEITNTRLNPQAAQLRDFATILLARNKGAEFARRFTPFIELTFVERDDPQSLATVAGVLVQQANAGEGIERNDLLKRCGLKIARDGAIALGMAQPVVGAAMPATSNDFSLDALMNPGSEPAPAPAPVTPALAASTVQDTALNGAQVSALMALVQSVVAKEIPAASALGILKASFPTIDAETASQIVNAAASATPPPVPQALSAKASRAMDKEFAGILRRSFERQREEAQRWHPDGAK